MSFGDRCYPMEYLLHLQEFGISRRVSVETGGFFSRAQLLIDGNPAPPGHDTSQFVLTRDDGTALIASLEGVLLDPVPKVTIEGRTLRAAPPFTFRQSVGAALSFLIAVSMSVVGLIEMPRISTTSGLQLMGFLTMSINLFMGVLLGFTSMIINRRIMRSEMTRSSQIFTIGAVTIVVVIGFLVVFLLLIGILTLFRGFEQFS